MKASARRLRSYIRYITMGILLAFGYGCKSTSPEGYELRMYQFSHSYSPATYELFESAIMCGASEGRSYREAVTESGYYQRNKTLLEYYAEMDGFLEDGRAFVIADRDSRAIFLYNKRYILNRFERLLHTMDGEPGYQSRVCVPWPIASKMRLIEPPLGRQQRCGEFQFMLWDDGSAAITRYHGPTTVALNIPSTVNGVTVSRIWNGAFLGRRAFTEVAIPEVVTHIGARAFMLCKSLEGISLRNGLLSIGDEAFYDTSLRVVAIPDSVVHVGNSAFRNTRALISLGRAIEVVGESAFGGCRIDGDSLVIPDSVRIIGDGAFHMTGVKTVTLGKSVESLHPLAFGSDIQEFRVHPDNAFYSALNGVLYDKKRLVLVRWPVARDVPPRDILAEGIERIGSYAFSYCGLERMDIPQGVTSIESNAFFKALSLREVRIGPDVSHIGRHAFLGCERLETLRFYGDAPETDGDPFREIYTQRYPSRRAMRHVSPESRPRWPGRTEVVRIEPPKGLVVQRLEGASGWRRWIRSRWHGIPVQTFDQNADGEDVIERNADGKGSLIRSRR